MSNTPQNPAFICPICQSPLVIGDKTWHCQPNVPVSDGLEPVKVKQHSFDVAKQGYINLLPVQQKKSKSPGDSEASIASRQRFLSAGHYVILQQGLIDFCQALLPKPIGNWLDIGCGEGYYSERLLSLASQSFIALDISKPAVMTTAKRFKALMDKPVSFAIVASASQAPLMSGSIDVISSIFSPILPSEFDRLLSDKGFVIIAKPGVNHLLELREALFDSVQAHDSDKFIDTLAPSFKLVKEQQVNGTIQVSAAELADLLTMTPYSYRAKPEKREALLAKCEQAGTLSLTIEFVIYGFAKEHTSTAVVG